MADSCRAMTLAGHDLAGTGGAFHRGVAEIGEVEDERSRPVLHGGTADPIKFVEAGLALGGGDEDNVVAQ